MKPITFESIRNLLKTKKKTKEKGIDTSFKRSDSFKRISIRKSYLERGRKRGLRPKTVIDFEEVEVKNGVFIGTTCTRNASCSGKNIIMENNEHSLPIGRKIDATIGKMEKIDELFPEKFLKDALKRVQNSSNNNNEKKIINNNNSKKFGNDDDIEVQTVEIDFCNYRNSTESIYNELLSTSDTEERRKDYEDDENLIDTSNIAKQMNSLERLLQIDETLLKLDCINDYEDISHISVITTDENISINNHNNNNSYNKENKCNNIIELSNEQNVNNNNNLNKNKNKILTNCKKNNNIAINDDDNDVDKKDSYIIFDNDNNIYECADSINYCNNFINLNKDNNNKSYVVNNFNNSNETIHLSSKQLNLLSNDRKINNTNVNNELDNNNSVNEQNDNISFNSFMINNNKNKIDNNFDMASGVVLTSLSSSSSSSSSTTSTSSFTFSPAVEKSIVTIDGSTANNNNILPLIIDNHNDNNNPPSLITFKTYCPPVKKYLETNFDCGIADDTIVTPIVTTKTSTSRCNIEINDVDDVKTGSSGGSSTGSNSSHVSRTSINQINIKMNKNLDTNTYKLIKRKSNEGVVIHIPAVNGKTNKKIEEKSGDCSDLEQLTSYITNEEISINSKCTFEIYKALHNQRKTAESVANKKADEKEQTSSREKLSEKSLSDDSIRNAYLLQEETTDFNDNIHNHSISGDSRDSTSSNNSTGNNKNSSVIWLNDKFHQNDQVSTPNIINTNFNFHKNTPTNLIDTATEEHDYQHHSILDDAEFLDDNDIITPDCNLAQLQQQDQPLKLKINHQSSENKEIYSRNFGRIWKSMNLGQDDDLSIIINANTNKINKKSNVFNNKNNNNGNGNGISNNANGKVKNESFKSMSSHDSGFSLTLTKPKNLFRRKSNKKNKNSIALRNNINNGISSISTNSNSNNNNSRKPKLSVSRDGYFKRVMIVQKTSSRRKKKKKSLRTRGRDLFKTSASVTDDYQDNYYHPHDKYTKINQNSLAVENAEDRFMQDFEAFCSRRNKNEIYRQRNFDELLNMENDNNFTQEINDLEAFYEEHLKRLKSYYLQRKKINETTIAEFYQDYQQRLDEATNAQRDYEATAAATSAAMASTPVGGNRAIPPLKQQNKITTNYNNSSPEQQLTLINNDRSSLLVDGNITSSVLDYSFPYPDKRVTSSGNGNNKKRVKNQFQEVRAFTKEQSDKLKYASLVFTENKGIMPDNETFTFGETVPYAEIRFPSKEFLEFPYWKLTRKKSTTTPKRTNRIYGKQKSFINGDIIDDFDDENNLYEDFLYEKREISLASIFPSVYQRNKNYNNNDYRCDDCSKIRRNNHEVISRVPEKSTKNTESYCEDGDGADDDTSDEFSEQEFLANSIGCELCLNCDKIINECQCLDEINENNLQLSNNSNDNEYCDCHNYDNIQNNDNEDNIIDNVVGREKFLRKKSKRRRAAARRTYNKNHSTFRRRYFNYYNCDITQKGYEKKRARLLQPYITKSNAQQGDGSSYYNLQKQQTPTSGIGIIGEIITTNDGYSYVDDVHSLQSHHSHHSHSHMPIPPPPIAPHQHLSQQQQQSAVKSSSSSSHHQQQHHHQSSHHQNQNRTRRTQRRVTHNEKRYHSGIASKHILHGVHGQQTKILPPITMTTTSSSSTSNISDNIIPAAAILQKIQQFKNSTAQYKSAQYPEPQHVHHQSPALQLPPPPTSQLMHNNQMNKNLVPLLSSSDIQQLNAQKSTLNNYINTSNCDNNFNLASISVDNQSTPIIGGNIADGKLPINNINNNNNNNKTANNNNNATETTNTAITTTTTTTTTTSSSSSSRNNRRIGRHESRYTSEVRQEAVQQALAALKNRPKPSLPMPSKRSSVLNRSPDRDREDSESSSDDGSIPEERISTPDRDNYNLPRDHITNSREHMKLPPPPIRDHSGSGGGGGNGGGGHHNKNSNMIDRRQPNVPSIPPPGLQSIHQSGQQQQPQLPSDTSSTGSPPTSVHRIQKNSSYEITDISDIQTGIRPYAAPDITQFSANTRRGADRVTRYVNITQTEAGDTGTTGRWKVSAKIQQLLNTLKRPKRRPLPEFYEDNDIELEIAANPKDPNAPKPEGNTMSPVQGEQLVVPTVLPRTLEAALQGYGVTSCKTPMATVLDPNGKLTTTLTYGKLLSRAQKIAYALSTKIFSKGPEQITLKPGDRVALVYPNSDPLNFITAWYGCMFRGLVPLPIELPLSSSDSPPQQIGFLLSSCGIQVALTSEACLKGLPKSSTGEITKLKGWPRLHWFVTEHLPKPPKDFNVNNVRINEDALAYIEYTSDKEGSVMGVTVSRIAMLNHCRALTMACHYTEGETVVCVLDFKREVGLWHSVLTSVLNGMHVLFIPYALMKLKPSSWMQLITKYRASCCLVKSRDLHWGLLATKDHKDISLASLRMLLVADGANPWSLSSCDQFLSVFQSKGLRPDAICPCASSSEAFTVSLRRPGRSTSGFNQSATTGRGVLSMAALSHGVVRVDSEDSLTSLTLQDCGQVMPATTMVVVRSEGAPVLCKTDQVGEICVTLGATGASYYGLDGLTNASFKVQPLAEEPDAKDPLAIVKPITDDFYVRSGLLGFLGPGGLVFVCGSRDGLMNVTGRKHNADDIIATVLAVEPMRFIYRGRIAVFSIKVLRDERVCVIAEQRPDCSEEESFQWMSRVLQAVDSIHQVGIYCLALVPPNHLPKTPLGGIHLCETRRRFLEGSLHPANVLMCPHTCVTNLPKPREMHQGALLPQPQVSGSSSGCVTDTSVGPASVMVGNLVQGNRLAVAQGRDIGLSDDSERKHQLITGVLRWRANSSPDHVLYTLLNSKGAVAKTLTCSELHKRAEKIAALLQERGKINPGDHVALIFPPGLDLICAFYGCLYLGAVPITIRPPHPQNLITTLPTVRMIVEVSKSGIVLSIQSIIKLLKSREAAASVDPKSWPPILDIDDNPKRKLAAIANSTLDSTAYLDFSVSTCGRLSGVIITHRSLSSVCASLKLACELYPSRHVALCLDPYCGLGFAMWTLISVYSGHHSILIAPYEVEANPSLWLSTLSQYRVRDTFCSYGVIELCTKALSNSIQMLKQRNVNLACVRTCVVVAEERPRVQLTQQFCKLFQALGLNTRCVSTSFGCRVNPAICVQGASSAESAQVYVDLRALRNNRVALVERGAPHSLCLIESGKLLPGVKVIIANPDTKGHCGDSHLGEIWVQSPHSADGYFTIYGDETDYNDHFNAKLVTGVTTEVYARTGYLGFLRRTECSQAGSILDETTPSIASRDSDTDSIHSQTIGTMNSQTSTGTGTGTMNNTTGTTTSGTTTITTGTEQELHDAVYVVGALDEVITLRGMNYHPIDIENSILRCHKKIAECAVFPWTNLLVVVAELDGNEFEALDLVPLVTNTVLEEHQLIVGIVVVVDPGVVPINSRGEKQRMHLRDGFLADQLDPIYVAYNM